MMEFVKSAKEVQKALNEKYGDAGFVDPAVAAKEGYEDEKDKDGKDKESDK